MMKDEQPIWPKEGDEQAFRVSYLIAGYIKQTLTEQEHEELDDWVTADFANQRLFEKLTDKRNLDDWKKWSAELPINEAFERAKKKIHAGRPNGMNISLFQRYVKYAAIFVALVGVIAVIVLKARAPKQGPGLEAATKDIMPGGNRATLTLSDGSRILLDSAQKGSLAKQGNVEVIKKDSGALEYKQSSDEKKSLAISYNTLSVPIGGTYQILLPDGSRAWLNSSSSLKYPTSFTDPQRIVELTGEGYFEVAKDAAHPFIVKAKNTEVEVTGTHFNVNAYPEEISVQVSLEQGSVEINGAHPMKAGEHADISASGQIKISVADLETALAWKDGLFLFKDARIDQVMKQASRWYGAEISYDANVSEHFNANVPRSVPASQLLHLLESTGSVHFKIEGKKITVMR